MKTTGYKTAQSLDTHPACLWRCLPAFVIRNDIFFPTNTEKDLIKNEVTGGNGIYQHI